LVGAIDRNRVQKSKKFPHDLFLPPVCVAKRQPTKTKDCGLISWILGR
jgi:hypothetical protein